MSVSTVLKCGDVVVSWWNVRVFYCDVFGLAYVYVDVLGYVYVCESYVVLDQCDEPPPCLCSLSVRIIIIIVQGPISNKFSGL